MRHPDWQVRLSDLLKARATAPFVWGQHDCVMFAADAAVAVTNRDPGEGWRGSYTDHLGAARIMRMFDGIEGIAADKFGDEVSVLMAQPGDIGLVDNDGHPCLAVCGGFHWHAPAIGGMRVLNVEHIQRAWRVDKE